MHDGAVELAGAPESVARRAPRRPEEFGGPPPQDLPAFCFPWLPHVARLGVAGLRAAATVVGLLVSLLPCLFLSVLSTSPSLFTPACLEMVTLSIQFNLSPSIASVFFFFYLTSISLLLTHVYLLSTANT